MPPATCASRLAALAGRTEGTDEAGRVTGSWLFDPDGTVLEGPQGLVSHLICGGVYDWSTGLVYRDGRYYDPMLGIWLALMPLVVVQSWRGRKRRRGMPWLVLVLCLVGVGGSLVGCGECPCPAYDWNPRDPGPYDDAIRQACVVIKPVVNGNVHLASLGTIVGEDGPDWIIYTHKHFDRLSSGVPLSDPSVTVIRVHNHEYLQNQAAHVNLLMIGTDPDAQVIEETGEITKLRVRKSKLDGTSGPTIGKPIGRIDGAAVNIDDKVDIAYAAPEGEGVDHVEIWHTKIVHRPTETSRYSGTVAVLGVPVLGEASFPGGCGDSGGGLFLSGEHIGNTFLWQYEKCYGGGGYADAFWLSFLNP